MGLINGFAKDWIMTAVSMAYIGLGIASLVLTSSTWSRNDAVNCGFGGVRAEGMRETRFDVMEMREMRDLM
jgi:hypothetical protein